MIGRFGSSLGSSKPLRGSFVDPVGVIVEKLVW